MSFFKKLSSALTKSSDKLSDGLTTIFVKKKLDEAALEQLEELLIEADLGASVALEMTEQISKTKFGKEVTDEEIRASLAELIGAKLEPVAKPLRIRNENKPEVILVVGVNGNGKTTTIGKLAHQFKAEGKTVMLAAADTFRAAAIEQLQVWADRSDIPLIKGEIGSDPASVAFRAVQAAGEQQVDVLMIDTAGRLQNKANLMEELKKIIRVMQKIQPDAPHQVVLVLDATTGQNALSQVQTFKDLVDVSGLVLTKLDGTAKGGIAVALAGQFGLPIHAIGVGEGIEDLQAFDAYEFSKSLCS